MNLNITINGEPRAVQPGVTLEGLLETMGIDRRKVAIERNLEIVPRSAYGATRIDEGDKLEIVHFIGGGAPAAAPPQLMDGARSAPGAETDIDADPLIIAGRRFRSRLIVGTGKYKDYAQNAAAARAAGAEIVTVALRRVNVMEPGSPMLVDHVSPKEFTYLPNTAGCFTGEEAVRTLRLAREAGGWDLVKLEVLGDKKSLFPDMVETLRAAEMLIKDGFQVMVYCSDDPIMAKRLEEIGCCAIMPLGAPIGSGLGIQNPVNIRLIVEQAQVPVIVDAGVGTASDATVAMELGCDGVLMNTAIAEAKDPIMMAKAMRLAVESGRLAYRAGRMQKRRYADPSSPLAGMI
jgi:thiazole synthase